MAVYSSKDNLQQDQLVFALSQHAVIGYIIEAFAVNVTTKGQFGYGFRKVTKATIWDHVSNTSPEENTLLDIIEKYSDDNLQKRFNRQRQRTRQFYDNLEPDFVVRHIRPFIEKVVYEAAVFMARQAMPLYFKGAAAERIQEQPVQLMPGNAEAHFFFEKQPDQTVYALRLMYKDREIPILNRGAELIASKPCLLFVDRMLFSFESDWDGKKLMPFFTKTQILVNKANEKQFYQKFVQNTLRYYHVEAKGFAINDRLIQPTPVLKLEQHWQGDIALGLYFHYSDRLVYPCGDTTSRHVKMLETEDSFAFDTIKRNFDFEKKLTALLLETGLKRLDGAFFSISLAKDKNTREVQSYQLIDWMSQQDSMLSANGFVLEKEIDKKRFFSGKTDLQLSLDEKHDWFDLYGQVTFGAFEIPFVQLKSHILNGIREFVLPDGTIALIPEEWFSKFHDIIKFGHKNGQVLELKKHHYPLLQKVEEDGIKLPRFDKATSLSHFQVPPMVEARLRAYQEEGFNWMMFLRQNKLGGCLADDMGLGKTLQVLTLLAQVHLHEQEPAAVQEITGVTRKSKIQPELFSQEEEPVGALRLAQKISLVIMPLSLVHNWTQEAKRFVPGLKVYQHTGPGRKCSLLAFQGYDVVLTTYGTIRNDVEFMKEYIFKYVILDESQIIKNASSKVFNAIKKLRAEHRLVLTGTPIENSLTDLWAQFSFLNPGMLGTLSFFKDEFVGPIEKKNDASVGDKLHKLISPFILRRTKDEVAKELPPLTEKIHYCEMTAEQEQYYETRKSEIRNMIMEDIEKRGLDKSKFAVLSGLMKLRLIANHPSLVDKDYMYDSGKYAEIIRSVENLIAENHKVLIFSQFVKHLNLFRDYFDQKKIAYSMLTGSVAEKDRLEIVNRFQNDDQQRLFLISLRAGGVGLNLTGADYVFMLDPWWNPAVESQAINRAHRIGQDKKVFVYKFITHNTVEEKIIALQNKKSELAGMFINHNNPLKSLGFEELNELMM